MLTAPQSFKRLVLGLQPSVPDRSVRLAVEFAQLLDLDLLGLFLEDSSLRDLAGIPFARELRLLGGGWHPLDLERLSTDLELAARSAEAIFTAAAKQLSTPWQFEVKRGPMATTIATVSQTSDIVVIVEPASAAERVTQPFGRLMQAAFHSAASVMIVPTCSAPGRGSIVALAAALDDPSITVAAAIARAAKADLVVVDSGENAIDAAGLHSFAAANDLPIKHIVADRALRTDPAALARALGPLRERLVVMTRSPNDGAAAALLAAERRVPVLLVEPPAKVR